MAEWHWPEVNSCAVLLMRALLHVRTGECVRLGVPSSILAHLVYPIATDDELVERTRHQSSDDRSDPVDLRHEAEAHVDLNSLLRLLDKHMLHESKRT